MNTDINGVKTLDTGCTIQFGLVIAPQPGYGLPIPLGFYRQFLPHDSLSSHGFYVLIAFSWAVYKLAIIMVSAAACKLCNCLQVTPK